MKALIILSIFLSFNQLSPIKINGEKARIAHVNTSQENLSHSEWTKLLQKYVDTKGLVNYLTFKKDETALDSYLQKLSENEPKENWSKQETLAYYINLYNAATVKLIVENLPINSIKDINRPWTKSRIQVGNDKLSLDDIEHKILRKMDEPRVHFALNCASISCPKLIPEAYTADKLNEQLERVTKEFINSSENNITSDFIQISSIFKWYRRDYKVNGKVDVIGFINQYSEVKINPSAKISYTSYDWGLNQQ